MDEKKMVNPTDVQAPDRGNRWINSAIFDLFDDGERLWFTSMQYNALFTIDKCTLNVNYVGSFPNEEFIQHRLYSSINEYDGKLFFTPCSAHEIGVYDMKKKQFDKINIGIQKQDNDLTKIKYLKKYVSSFLYNGKLVLLPCCCENVIIYDIQADTICSSKELFEHFYEKYNSDITSSDEQFYLCWNGKRVNDSEVVFDMHCNKNIVVLYDLERGGFRELEIGDKDRTYSYIECDGRHIYLYDEKVDRIVMWEIEEGRCVEKDVAENISGFIPCGLEHSFANMVLFGEWLYLIPANANATVRMHVDTLYIETVDVLSAECAVPQEGAAYSNLCRVFGDKLYLSESRSKKIAVYSEDGALRRIPINVAQGDIDTLECNYLIQLIHNKQLVFNEEQVPLNIFLNVISCLETT